MGISSLHVHVENKVSECGFFALEAAFAFTTGVKCYKKAYRASIAFDKASKITTDGSFA